MLWQRGPIEGYGSRLDGDSSSSLGREEVCDRGALIYICGIELDTFLLLKELNQSIV